jgi:hypothetical protein
MKTLICTLFISLLSSAVIAQQTSNTKANTPATFIVDAFLPVDANNVWTGEKLRVTLRNNSKRSVKVISRMAMGYPGRGNSELYTLITTQSSGEEVGKEVENLKELIDFHAEPVSDVDFKWLNPGETITVEIDLKEWYDIPAGDMELQVVYSGDHAVSQDKDLLRGQYKSNTVKFTSQPIAKQ